MSNRLTPLVVAGVTGNGAGAAVSVQSASAYFGWKDTAGKTDASVWDFGVAGGVMYLRAVNDAGNGASNIFTVNRTGAVATQVNFYPVVYINVQGPNGLQISGNSQNSIGLAITNTVPNGRSWSIGTVGTNGLAPAAVGALYVYDNTATSNNVRTYWDTAGVLNQLSSMNVTGTLTSTSAGGGAVSAFVSKGANAFYGFNATGSATDAAVWDIGAANGVLYFRAINDAGSVAPAWLTVGRTGAVINGVTFGCGVNQFVIRQGYDTAGVGNNPYGGQIALVNTSFANASSNPATYTRYMRLNKNVLEWVNNAGSVIASMGDDGSMNLGGNLQVFGSQVVIGNSQSSSDQNLVFQTNKRITRFDQSYAAGQLYFIDDTAGLIRFTSDVSGNFTTAGTLTQNSDVRRKTDLTPIEGVVDKLLAIEAFNYTDIASGERRIGVSAQSVVPSFPEAVLEDEHGMLSVAYGNVALAALVEYVKVMEKRMAGLEVEVMALNALLQQRGKLP